MSVVGREAPRISTQPLRLLTPATSLGFEAIEFASTFLGIELLPWQRWWLIHALELDANGDFRFRSVLTLVARQNGKTHLLKALALWAMFTGRVRLVLGAAQSLDIARESWQGAVELAEADPDLRAEVANVRRANGEQEIRLDNGARYKITAATRSAGRGLSVDLLILDELREHSSWEAWNALSKTTMARPTALIVGISNAGDDQSVVLNALRDAAISGKDDRAAIFEWSAPDGCDIDDPDAWAQANPGLGHTITEAAIRSALSTDPPGAFRTEVLCQRVTALDNAIDLRAWTDCADPSATMDSSRDRVTACLDVAPDGQRATLAVAVQRAGWVQVEAVADWVSLKDCREQLPELLAKINPVAFGWFPNGPAAAIAAELKGLRKAVELKTEVAAVCQGLADLVTSRQLRHASQETLTAQVAGASKLISGDGWRFTRRGSGHVDALYAIAGAAHLARTNVSLGRPRIILAQSAVS